MIQALELWGQIGTALRSKAFAARARKRPSAFTRLRKVGVVGVASIILNLVRRSTQIELDDYIEQTFPHEENMTYTKQSFAEARQNLRPEAFQWLNEVFLQGFYRDGDEQTYRGFRLLAVDGSVVELPNTAALRKRYGTSENQSPRGTLARARSSALYDVLNGMVIHTILERYDASERAMAKTHITAGLTELPRSHPNLVLFDRGYPSLEFFLWLRQHGVRYLMRVPATGFLGEVVQAPLGDSSIQVPITADRARKLKRQGTPVPVGTVLTFRVLKFPLSSGEIETVITDLTREELPADEGPSLYFRRWGIETHYDDKKSKFEIENFSGQTPIVLEQDFHATTLLSNMAVIAQREAQAAAAERIQASPHKYEEYHINRNLLVGKMKDRLIRILLEDDAAKREAAFQRLVHQLQRNVIPVRPGRTAPRNKRPRRNKYPPNRRRCL